MATTVKEKTHREELLDELESIRVEADGVLKPIDVIKRAEDEDNILHNYFEWDNTKAGYSYRLWQARQLIKTTVIILPNTNEPIQAYFSLREDRRNGDGYRAIVEIISDKEKRQAMLREALSDLRGWQHKYNQLKELKPIFDVAERIQEQLV